MKLPKGVASRYVAVGPIRTHYLEAGSGEPVVLLHSAEFGGRAEFSWRHNIAALAEHFHVFAPDMVGFGGTDKIYNFTDPAGFRIRFIRDWMNTLCIPSAHFIGNSFGGSLILSVAASRPTPWNIRSIVTSSGGGFAPVNDARTTLNDYDGSRDWMRRILQVLFWDERWWSDEEVEERWQASCEPGTWAATAAARLTLPGLPRATPPERPDYRMIAVPTLITGGAEDLLREPGTWEDLHRQIPNAELHIFPRARHCPHIEFADEFNRLATEFISRHLTGEVLAGD
ncbi:MAG TPA: alpha/beta hydrolase [Chloroflexota bacterium]|nr:alpha/beta hydrolase [Chloroflexota bacterium]